MPKTRYYGALYEITLMLNVVSHFLGHFLSGTIHRCFIVPEALLRMHRVLMTPDKAIMFKENITAEKATNKTNIQVF